VTFKRKINIKEHTQVPNQQQMFTAHRQKLSNYCHNV